MNDIYYNNESKTLFFHGITPKGAPFTLSRKDDEMAMHLEWNAVEREGQKLGSVGMALRTGNCGYIWYCLTRGVEIPKWYFAHNEDNRPKE